MIWLYRFYREVGELEKAKLTAIHCASLIKLNPGENLEDIREKLLDDFPEFKDELSKHVESLKKSTEGDKGDVKAEENQEKQVSSTGVEE